MTLAGPPTGRVEIPDAVRGVAHDRPVQAVWQNQLGGITWRIGAPAEHYVKWQPTGVTDLRAEADRLHWLRAFTPVPDVIELGEDDDAEWLVTVALRGRSAVDDRWKSDPEPSVRAIGAGLRRFHDAVPVDGCPFDWSVATRLAAHGDPGVGPEPEPEPEPEIDRLVVCHGDACAPNTLVDDGGAFVAHVDLGSAGVADRWADLAVASWSLDWNFGAGWGVPFFEAYGVDPDPARIAFYRRLWDAT